MGEGQRRDRLPTAALTDGQVGGMRRQWRSKREKNQGKGEGGGGDPSPWSSAMALGLGGLGGGKGGELWRGSEGERVQQQGKEEGGERRGGVSHGIVLVKGVALTWSTQVHHRPMLLFSF